MKASTLTRSARNLLLLCSLLLTSSSYLFASQYEEGVSSQEYLFVKGIIQSVSPQEQSITVKALKGPRIKILMQQQTEMDGFVKIEDLQPNENVKIWYRPDQHGNIGLKIVKLPELGC
jgi:hypothetical protein